MDAPEKDKGKHRVMELYAFICHLGILLKKERQVGNPILEGFIDKRGFSVLLRFYFLMKIMGTFSDESYF